MASGESTQPAQGGLDGSPVAEESGLATERRSATGEITEVSFPVSVRGYDRGVVDAYVSRVQSVVAELEATRSPEAAVKQALEQVGEQTKRVLAQAGETAEQITLAARREAEDTTARAKENADSVVAAAKAEAAENLARSQAEAEATTTRARTNAAEHIQRVRAEAATVREETEARLHELQADTEAVRRERSSLVDDLSELASAVTRVARGADDRFPPAEADQPEEGGLHDEAAGEGAAEDAATEVQAPELSPPSRSSV